MTNHKNGTYSFSYERPSASKILVQVYLLNPGEVHQDFYEASNLGSYLAKSNTVNYLNFDSGAGMLYGSGQNDYSVLLNSCIMFPYNGPTQLKYACENSCSIYLNENYYAYNLGVNDTFNNEIYTTVSTNGCYSLVTYVSKHNSPFNFKLSRKSSTNCNYQQIPITSIYLPTLVDSSFNIQVKDSVCGDSLRTGTESCDDGNISDIDGCNSSCNEESNWGCFGGSPNSKDTCILCNQYISTKPDNTFCYDGNNNDGDGCSSHCHIELGWTCSGGSASSNDSCNLKCGLLTSKTSNYCYDGNNDNGDGCDSSCSIESGWTCNENNDDETYSCTEICGDGKRFNDNCSYCDDGNTAINDGCNGNCEVERGWVCIRGNSINPDSCSEICGDGIKFNSNRTYCDDNNNSDGDGCSSSCNVETGWACIGGNSTAKDTCEICGDGKKYTTALTFCDDGNTKDNDGCSSNCSIEAGWECSGGNLTTKDTCLEICGDGRRFNSNVDYCDDGDLISSDGCSSNCIVEKGWNCSGGSSVKADTCVEVCGDGIRFNTNSTYCDDGNIKDGDGCNPICTIESNWKCSGGDSDHKDECIEMLNQGKIYW